MFLKNNLLKHININPLVKNSKRAFVFIALLLCFSSLFAQYNVSKTDNSRVKWREINTNEFQLVYPQSYELRAQRLALVLDTMFDHIGTTLGTNAPKIPILIHPYTAKSNGMTTWAPKRLEFYPTPSPTYFAYPWDWHLVIHEYRHACQYYAPYKGVSKTLTNLLGEHFLLGVNALLIPNWFIEGDAVLAETALASTGRGQNPEFYNQFKAQLLEKGAYKFHKAKLESMKDFVPNDYVFGYYMASYARNKYGKDVFADVMTTTAKSWWKFLWFNKADSLNLKLPHRKIYAELIDSIMPLWKEDYNNFLNQKENKSKLDTFNIKKEYYTHYLNPILIGKDTILALQSSSFEVQKLVQYTPNGLEEIVKLPYLMHSYFDYKNGKLLYSQNALDKRWEQETYANIIELDIYSGKTKTLTKNKTFFTPTYSPINENQIACIESTNEYAQSLVVLNFDEERNYTIKRIISSDAISYPAWSEDGKYIYLIETSSKGKNIVKVDIENGNKEEIISPSYDNISNLRCSDNTLYFLKDIDSKYELIAYDLNSKTAKQLTETAFGLGGYCLKDNELIVSAYNSDGYFLAKSSKGNQNLDINKKNKPQIFVEELQRQENFLLPIEYNDTIRYESKEYKKINNLFNFHSWLPVFLNLKKVNFGLGVSASSQNLLSTSIFQVGYKYNVKDSWHGAYMTYTYSGFYPIIDLEAEYKLRNFSDNKLQQEYLAGVNIGLPYSWSTRRTVNKLQLDFKYTLSQLEKKASNPYNILGYGVSYTHLHAKANNDITPTKGFEMEFSQSSTLGNNVSNITSATTKFYLPLFFKNSSTELNFAYQYNNNNIQGYEFENQIDFIRGVKNQFPTKYYGAGLTFNIPLFYPDWIIGPIFYIKRVSVKPFYDIGSFDTQIYQSFGNDFSFNLCVFGIKLPIEIGARVGFETLNQKPFFQFLLSL